MMNYRKKTFWLIAIATFIKIIIAATIGLGNDEVYYRLYAAPLEWNYFDHPPMVGWSIRFFTFNLNLDVELFIRLTSIVSSAFTTWIIYLIGKKIKNEHTGFLAALIYTSTIYGSIIAGTFILPDSPQVFFWSLSILYLINATPSSEVNNNSRKYIFLFGITTGLGMMCKIHTSFLWIGFIGYVLFYNRNWLKEPIFYLSGIITIGLFFPVIKWNFDNHFVTYLYHSNRVNKTSGGFNINTFLAFVFGQIFYTQLLLFPAFMIAIAGAFKNKWNINPQHNKILLFTAIPLIIIPLYLSCFNQVLPHWSGPAFISVTLITATYFDHKKPSEIPLIVKSALAFLFLIILAGILLINFFPGTLGKKDELKLGEGDFTLDMYGWNDLKNSMDSIYTADVNHGFMKSNASIICNKWFPAAHLDYYVARPLHKNLLVWGDTSDIHQYAG